MSIFAKGFDMADDQRAFRWLYEELAVERDVVFSSDFHAGLRSTSLLGHDGFHPNEAGAQRMAQNISDELRVLILEYQADAVSS